MDAILQDFKVFWAVVVLTAVLVMNMLPGGEGTAERLCHYQAVLVDAVTAVAHAGERVVGRNPDGDVATWQVTWFRIAKAAVTGVNTVTAIAGKTVAGITTAIAAVTEDFMGGYEPLLVTHSAEHRYNRSGSAFPRYPVYARPEENASRLKGFIFRWRFGHAMCLRIADAFTAMSGALA